MTVLLRVVLLAALAVVAVVAVLADVRTPIRAVDDVGPVPVQPPTSGALHCPSPAGEDEGLRIEVATTTQESAHVRVELGDEVVSTASVEPDAPEVVEVPAGEAGVPVSIRWETAPVAASVTTVGSRPVAALCAEEISPVWYLAGFDTRLGNEADLLLANPFSVDAVARVRFATPGGAVELVTTQDLAVPVGEQVVVDLDEVQPEVAELGVVVEMLTGRAVAVGRESFGPPDEDTPAPTGRSVVPALAQPLIEQVIPYSAVGQGADSELVVMNPSDVDAVVAVTTSSPDAEAERPGEIEVPAGGTVRVDLAGLSQRFTLGTTVTSLNEVPVVAARLATRSTDGTAVDVGTGVAPGLRWTALGGGTDGRQSRIDVVNAAGEPVRVDLVPVGVAQPSAWRDLEIEANGQVGVPLSDLGVELASVPIHIEADGPIAVSVRTAASDRAAEGFRSLAGWALPDASDEQRTRPTVQRQPGLAVAPTPTPSPTAHPGASPDPAAGAGSAGSGG